MRRPVKGAMGSWAGRSLPPGSEERSFRNPAPPKVSAVSRAERPAIPARAMTKTPAHTRLLRGIQKINGRFDKTKHPGNDPMLGCFVSEALVLSSSLVATSGDGGRRLSWRHANDVGTRPAGA